MSACCHDNSQWAILIKNMTALKGHLENEKIIQIDFKNGV